MKFFRAAALLSIAAWLRHSCVAFSVVPSGRRSQLVVSSSSSSPPDRTTSSSSLAAAASTAPSNHKNSNNDSNDDISSQLRSTRPFAEPLPANLRRKVKADRPARGHVVPKRYKVKGSGGSANPRLRPQGKARQAGLNNPSLLQISAGTAKGRRLDSPSVYLRPMMGKVREAVFSTLTSFGLYGDSTQSIRHLDIFAGSGSVGLESLSRGAHHCTFVDLSPDCCAAVHRNVAWCQFTDTSSSSANAQARVVCAEAVAFLKDPYKVGGLPLGTATYQLVTLCPPYEEIVYGDLLEAAVNSPVVGDDTVVVVEYPVELGCLPHVLSRRDGGAAVGVRNRRYGRTVIAMYVVNPTGRLAEPANSRPEEFIAL